ncbi:hypothetical protein SAMN05216188_103100 [Lentzea xinjiangensis]|uniref:VOC domain-containing protein n=1 Tax=Lentzea xinjiangensis TaxID=402600 RepID=A0A1H9G777_9PSEU|nr:glyoxalase [Lentzea xinjiangensis]SEQ45880.1 hypothetical protein SAMN05216188_103100 [Lentzea xinjiangensis]
MPRPVHFEIHAAGPDRARRFCSAVFGWKIGRWGDLPYWTITTGEDDQPGVNGGLLPRRGPAPAPDAPVHGYVVTISAADIDATIAAIDVNGGTVALPKDEVPGVGLLAYYRDTEANIFGVLQPAER